MNKLSLLLLSLLSFSLVGCGYETEKNILQVEFDESNPKGNRAICIMSADSPQYTISLKDPYITFDVQPGIQKYEYHLAVNNEIRQRLAVFAEIGLLNQEKLPNGQYRYTPTDEGRHYISDRSSDRFCFGRVVVTDIKYEKKQSGLSLFTYRYYLENVPDWAKDERLYQINISIQSLADARLENGKDKWWGGMVFFTSDNKISPISGVAPRFSDIAYIPIKL